MTVSFARGEVAKSRPVKGCDSKGDPISEIYGDLSEIAIGEALRAEARLEFSELHGQQHFGSPGVRNTCSAREKGNDTSVQACPMYANAAP
jgi:hypothetical protein